MLLHFPVEHHYLLTNQHMTIDNADGFNHPSMDAATPWGQVGVREKGVGVYTNSPLTYYRSCWLC